MKREQLRDKKEGGGKEETSMVTVTQKHASGGEGGSRQSQPRHL